MRKSVELPTCTFTKKHIKSLAEIFETLIDEYVSTVPTEILEKKRGYNEKYLFPSYKIIFEDLKVEAHTFKEIEDYWKEDVISIEMFFNRFGDNSIDITLDFTSDSDYRNSISIVGENDTWVLGTQQKIIDFLNSCKNNHHLSRGTLRYVLQPLLGYSFLLIGYYLLKFFANFFPATPSEPSSTSGMGYVMVYVSVLGMSYVVGWMLLDVINSHIFPKIEYENPSNMRKRILKIAGLIFYVLSSLATIYSWIRIII